MKVFGLTNVLNARRNTATNTKSTLATQSGSALMPGSREGAYFRGVARAKTSAYRNAVNGTRLLRRMKTSTEQDQQGKSGLKQEMAQNRINHC